MKKFIHILFISLILLGCNKDDSNNDQNSTWMFEVTIGGTTHKAEGSGPDVGLVDNRAFTSESSAMWYMQCKISDPSSSTYVSGNLGHIQLEISNPTIGIQTCKIYGSWLNDAADALGFNAMGGYSLTSGGTPILGEFGTPEIYIYVPINITDLGSAGDGSGNGYEPLKGNCSEILYFQSY